MTSPLTRTTARRPADARAGFASAAVLAAGIILSCNLPKDQPPVRFPEPECADMGMGLEDLDRCLSARERYVPLYSVTVVEPPAVGQDAGALDAGAKAALAPGCTENMSRVGPFCIDQYEAYVIEEKDGKEAVHPFNEPLSAGARYIARCEKGVFPQGYISGEQAEEACRNAGKRLCTMPEWRSACMGSQGYAYNYRPDRPDDSGNKCNTRRIWQPGVLFPGGNYDLNDPRLNALPGGLARTGENAECTSDHKVYDMLGNLHEWVSTKVDASMIHGDGRTNIPGVQELPGNGMFLGGFYTLDPSCYYAIKAHAFSHHDYSTGFRCCMDPGK